MKKRILTLTLALVMLLSFAACSANKNEFVGTWATTIDLSDTFNAGMAEEDATMAEYLAISGFCLNLSLILNEDYTYTFDIDEAALAESCTSVNYQLARGMEQYLVDYLASYGMYMTAEEAAAAMGIDVENLFLEVVTEMADELSANFNQSGTYDTENNIFTLTPNEGEATSDYYTLEGDVLTLEIGDREMDEYEAMLYPYVFHKVA